MRKGSEVSETEGCTLRELTAAFPAEQPPVGRRSGIRRLCGATDLPVDCHDKDGNEPHQEKDEKERDAGECHEPAHAGHRRPCVLNNLTRSGIC